MTAKRSGSLSSCLAVWRREELLIRSGPRSLHEGKFILREITRDDTRMLFEWRMEPATRMMFKTTGEVPFEAHERFVNRYFSDDNDERWFILEHEGVPVATHALYDIRENGDSEWGRLIVPPNHRGHGYGFQIFKMTVDYARVAGLRRIRSEVLSDNDVTLRLHWPLGFREESRQEQAGRMFSQLVLDIS